MGCLWSRLLWHYPSLSIPVLVVASRSCETMVQCFVCHSISASRFDLIVVKDVRSHTYVFPNIECIFSAKSFSLANPSLLSSLRQVLSSLCLMCSSRQRTPGHRKNSQVIQTGYPSGRLAAIRAFQFHRRINKWNQTAHRKGIIFCSCINAL